MLFLLNQEPPPCGCRGRPSDTLRPPGERPVCLLGLRLAARASALFRILRPGRACLRNSPARASDKAGPPRFLPLRDASARDFVSSSAASWRNQGGPVSPDARAGSRLRMLRTLTTPWTGFVRADRTNLAWGPFVLTPLVGSGGVCPFALYRVLHRFALRDARRAPWGAKSSYQLFAGSASLRVGRSNNRLGPIASSNNRLGPIAKAPHPATTLPLGDEAARPYPYGRLRRSMPKAATSFWLVAPPWGSAEAAAPGRFSPCASIAIAQPSAGLACSLPAQSRRVFSFRATTPVALPLPGLRRAWLATVALPCTHLSLPG